MIYVIKIGGNIIDDTDKLQKFLEEFGALPYKKILIHGGGKIATSIGDRLNIEAKYIDGRRITDEQTLELVTMVYGGLINKNIVAQLQKNKCNAIGLTGADANIMLAKKREVKEVDYGFAGDINNDGVDSKKILQFLELGLTPVIAPLTHDDNGIMLNTNADTIAQEIAKAIAKINSVSLIYGFEKAGVLKDKDDAESVIKNISITDFDRLVADGIIIEGMIPKISNACNAVKSGVSSVTIGNALQLNDIISGKSGTIIK